MLLADVGLDVVVPDVVVLDPEAESEDEVGGPLARVRLPAEALDDAVPDNPVPDKPVPDNPVPDNPVLAAAGPVSEVDSGRAACVVPGGVLA